jgi:hypothetical protein
MAGRYRLVFRREHVDRVLKKREEILRCACTGTYAY